MREHDVEMTADDLAEISLLLVDMAGTTKARAGDGGAGLTSLLLDLAEQMAGVWLAGAEGREADAVTIPGGRLINDDLGHLEDAARRLEGMREHAAEHRPDDVPWAFLLDSLYAEVKGEIQVRQGAKN